MKIEIPEALLIEVAKVFRQEAVKLEQDAYCWEGPAKSQILELARKNRQMSQRLLAERLRWKP